MKEAMKLALEALEKVTTELLAVRDEIAERGGRPTTNVFHQRLWDSSFKAYTDYAIPTASAIKEALKQEQGEPMAWMFQHEETGRIVFVEAQQLEWGFEKGNPRLKNIGPLYTTPQQRKPLTEFEKAELINKYTIWSVTAGRWVLKDFDLIDAVEAAHGIKE